MTQRAKRHTRDTGTALTGRPGVTDKHEGTTDPLTEEFNIVIPLVASAAEQSLTLAIGANQIITDAYLRIVTPSDVGASTINIGTLGGVGTELLNAQAITVAGTFPASKDVVGDGTVLTYTFSSGAITTWKAELLLRAIDFAE